MSRYSDYDFYDDEFEREARQLYADKVAAAQSFELGLWRDVTGTVKHPKLKNVLQQACDKFEEGKFWEADELLLDNYGMIAGNSQIENFIEKVLRSEMHVTLHPGADLLHRQIQLSKAAKPEVGQHIQRRMSVIQDSEGFYEVTPSVAALSDRNTPILRVIKDAWDGKWVAVGVDNRGIVTYLDEVPEPHWSHIEITSVSGRHCRGKALYNGLEQLVKDSALSLYESLKKSRPYGVSNKVRIKINWLKEC